MLCLFAALQTTQCLSLDGKQGCARDQDCLGGRSCIEGLCSGQVVGSTTTAEHVSPDTSSGAGDPTANLDSGASTAHGTSSDFGDSGAAPASTTNGEPVGDPAVWCLFADAGLVTVGTGGNAYVTVRNETGDHLTVHGAEFVGPFAFAGGAFPGTLGTCDQGLQPYGNCTLDCAFMPAVFGTHWGAVVVAPSQGPEVTCNLAGIAVGQTANLVINGDGERLGVPPPGWAATQGQWIASTEAAHGGSASLIGYGNGSLSTLAQRIDLTPWHSAISENKVFANATVWGRLLAGDSWSYGVRYFDGDGVDIGGESVFAGSHTSWQRYDAGPHNVPDHATTVELAINCNGSDGAPCGAFDDISFAIGYE